MQHCEPRGLIPRACLRKFLSLQHHKNSTSSSNRQGCRGHPTNNITTIISTIFSTITVNLISLNWYNTVVDKEDMFFFNQYLRKGLLLFLPRGLGPQIYTARQDFKALKVTLLYKLSSSSSVTLYL